MIPRIGVVIPARNEEKYIKQTLTAIKDQTLQPEQIVLVNDNSTDKTVPYAEHFRGVYVTDFPYSHEDWVIRKELAEVFNQGLKMMNPDLDYVTIVGADEVLPKNHFKYITKKMRENNLVIASGKIMGEQNTIPRGSGRIVDWKWWQSIGGLYPVNFGYESWLIGKCFSMNKKLAVYPEILSTVQRPTGSNYKAEKYYHRGQAYHVLGYNRRFILGRMLVLIFRQHKIHAAKRMIQGFLFGPVELYDKGVRDYYRTLQNHQTSLRNIPWMIRQFRSFKTD